MRESTFYRVTGYSMGAAAFVFVYGLVVLTDRDVIDLGENELTLVSMLLALGFLWTGAFFFKKAALHRIAEERGRR